MRVHLAVLLLRLRLLVLLVVVVVVVVVEVAMVLLRVRGLDSVLAHDAAVGSLWFVNEGPSWRGGKWGGRGACVCSVWVVCERKYVFVCWRQSLRGGRPFGCAALTSSFDILKRPQPRGREEGQQGVQRGNSTDYVVRFIIYTLFP
jgi:hypothetical protein